MIFEVVYLVDETTHRDVFTGNRRSGRQLRPSGLANLVFRDGSGRDCDGRKIRTAQYVHAEVIYSYDEED